MSHVDRQSARRASQSSSQILCKPLLCAGMLSVLVASGCGVDSFMDPSVIGRWEKTPASVPILDRIATIEGPEDTLVEFDDVRAEDLIPMVEEYTIGSGDLLDIMIWDLPVKDQTLQIQRVVDARGYIDLPQVGEVHVAGRTPDGAREAMAEVVTPLVGDPLITVIVANQRQHTFHAVGAVRGPGMYLIPAADYRLIEALSAAGWFGETAEWIYVIRQVPLSSDLSGIPRPEMAGPQGPSQGEQEEPSAEDLLDIIDELSEPEKPGSAPGVLSAATGNASLAFRQPGGTGQPPIDLLENQRDSQNQSDADTSWVYVDGRWVRVKGAAAASTQNGSDISQLVTQRVIRIKVAPLLAGDMTFNIVIRPGDVLRVPSPTVGLVYMGGEVGRPGPFNLPGAGRLTLMRAILAAGGLGPVAVPERVDLVRITGENRQAMIRLNARAIFEGTQPDVYLNPDDIINVGTEFWATPLAVFRGGMRASYGFGFLLDRNFGSDIFGAPPIRRIN